MMTGPVFMAKALQAFDPLRRTISLGLLRGIGWPVLGGLTLMLVGAVLLGVSQHLHTQKNRLQLELRQSQKSAPKPAPGQIRGAPVIFPSSADYTADLAQIFDIAKNQGIVLASGDYHDAAPTALDMDTRLVDLRIDENYGKLKEFLANVLNAMPHAAVQELRIERKDGATAKHQVFLKLALVYSPRPATAQAPQSAASRIPGNVPGPHSVKAAP